MTHRHRHGCGPRGRFEINIPEGLFAMGGGRGSWGPFHFDFGDEDGGWGGRSRGRRRMFDHGELRLVLLKLLADEPRHGYELRKTIEELTGGAYAPSPGALYPTLLALADEGVIVERSSEGSIRNVYEATDEGRAELADKAEEVEALFERLEETGSHRRRRNRPEMGRAIGNLMTALRNRIAHEGWNEALLNEVVEILDDAAQRIERAKPQRPDEEEDA